jgi:hypothetical protein
VSPDRLARLIAAPVMDVAVRPYAYATSHPLEELELALAGGGRLRLLVKDAGTRELAVYEGVLAGAGLGTPRFYGVDGARLVLEKVDGVELWQVGELETWARVAAWLRKAHVALASYANEAFLLHYERAHFELSLRRALAAHPDIAPVAAAYAVALDRALALPRTVIHGELYPSNVLVAGERICAVDWETAGVGPPLLDLAALVTGWGDAERTAIAAAYGAVAQRDLDACRLLLAIRWLGRRPGWRPPPEHARDWRAEALELAEGLA